MRIVQVSVGSVRMPPEEGWAPMQVLVNISKHLAKMGHEVVILDRKYSKDDPDTERLENIEIIRLKAWQIRPSKVPRFIDFFFAELNAVVFALKVSRYLKKNRKNVDAVHLHYSSIGSVLAILNRGLRKRMFYTCHLSHWALPPGTMTKLERISVFVDSWLMRRIKKVVALNESAKESFVVRGRVRRENIVVIPNGVDTDFFNPNVPVEDTVSRYGLAGRATILFVGRLARIKGVDCLMDAASIVVKEFGYKDVLFVFVGSPEFDSVDRPINSGGSTYIADRHDLKENLLFTGSLKVEGVRALYAASDLFVLPSLGEADPLVTLEAMASGKPVIATKVGGIPRQVRDGLEGFLIDVGDCGQLADKIRYLLDKPDERKTMGLNARKRAEEEFGWGKVAERLSEIYQS